MPDIYELMQGITDPRSARGVLSRGNNVYPGGTNNAGHAGGRPATGQINPLMAQRLLKMNRSGRGGPIDKEEFQGRPGAPTAFPQSPMDLEQMKRGRATTDPSSQELAYSQRQNMMQGLPPQLANKLAMVNLRGAAQRRLGNMNG